MSKSRSQAAEAKPKSLAEDLIEALHDERLIDALGKALSPLITLSVQEAVKKQLEGLTTTIRELKADNTRLAKQCELVAKDNARLQKTTEEYGRRLDDMEAYSRRDNLIIRGLPEKSVAERASDAPSLTEGVPVLRESFESVEGTVLEFLNSSLGVVVQPQDISIAHRLKSGPKDRVRPIIVKFKNQQVRNSVYRAKKQLKNTGSANRIYISEHLTKSASDLFFTARRMVKDKRIASTWTQNGQVFVKVSSTDPTARGKLVKSAADLAI